MHCAFFKLPYTICSINQNIQEGLGYVFNGLTHDSYVVEYQRKEDCMSHDTYENIIEKDWSAKTTTLEEIVSYIKKELGDNAVVTFDREIASIANCHCGKTKDLYLPVHKLTGEILTCPKCGNQMSFDSFHIIKGDEDFLNKTPYEIGIPLLHIIGGKVGINTTYYEFSGDEKEIFDGLEEEQ